MSAQWASVLSAVLVVAPATTARAQEKPDTASNGDWADRVKNPVDWFKWGADARLRHDSAENPSLTEADPPGHSLSFERLRLREWNTISPCKAFELNFRLLWEGRHFWAPASKKPWDASEVLLDALTAKLELEIIPLSLVVGRQDIVFGDGWLVFDGTPRDGPRTSYFEAVRATVDLRAIDSVLDLLYIDQTSSADRRLPPFFSKGTQLIEQNERGAIAYLSNKSIERAQLDAYFIYKHDEAVLSSGDNGDIVTIGGRLARDFGSGVSGRMEGAYQFGHRRNAVMFPNQDGSLSAWGLHGRLTYGFGDPSKNQAWLGYEVLSGADARDVHNHQFDLLWGRWARYSELFPNDLDSDRPSDRSNFHRVNLGYQIEPVSGMLIQANYHAFFAYANRFSGTPGFSEHGRFKGHLLTALLRYRLNRYLSGHLLGECFFPGNYYAAPSDSGPLHTRTDPAAFLRAELVVAF